MTATLVAAGLTVVRGPLLVLSEVSLTVAPGMRIGVVGPNGVGKSTLLSCLAGELAPDSGTVSLSPTSGCCRRSRSGHRARRCSSSCSAARE